MIRSLSISLVLAALVGVASAHAADEKFCHDYAREAAKQFNDGSSHPDCKPFFRDQVRWNGDEHHHFDWCMHTDRKTVDDERGARRHDLEACTKHHDHDHDHH